jgi:uncharacterized membrane protein YhaH (DUF805 family)
MRLGASPWENWFAWTGRRNRVSFFLATFSLGVMLLLAVLVIGFFSKTTSGRVLFQVAFAIPAAVSSYLLTAQRLRDINVTGWLALLWIPAGLADNYLRGAASLTFWLVLLALPGTAGENRYGSDPLGSEESIRTLASTFE